MDIGSNTVSCLNRRKNTKNIKKSKNTVDNHRNLWYKCSCDAEVAELADAQASGACGSNTVRVQVPPSAFFFYLRFRKIEKGSDVQKKPAPGVGFCVLWGIAIMKLQCYTKRRIMAGRFDFWLIHQPQGKNRNKRNQTEE